MSKITRRSLASGVQAIAALAFMRPLAAKPVDDLSVTEGFILTNQGGRVIGFATCIDDAEMVLMGMALDRQEAWNNKKPEERYPLHMPDERRFEFVHVPDRDGTWCESWQVKTVDRVGPNSGGVAYRGRMVKRSESVLLTIDGDYLS